MATTPHQQLTVCMSVWNKVHGHRCHMKIAYHKVCNILGHLHRLLWKPNCSPQYQMHSNDHQKHIWDFTNQKIGIAVFNNYTVNPVEQRHLIFNSSNHIHPNLILCAIVFDPGSGRNWQHIKSFIQHLSTLYTVDQDFRSDQTVIFGNKGSQNEMLTEPNVS